MSPQLAGLPAMGEFEADVEVHEQRYELFKRTFKTEKIHRLILKPGRTDREVGFILVSNNEYRGVGFIPKNKNFRSEPSTVLKHLQPKKPGHLPDRIVEKELMNADDDRVLTLADKDLKLPT